MKKLYRKGTVHPSPLPPLNSSDHLLPLLPVAILSLVTVLSLEDREVLAYLISTNKTKPQKKVCVDKNHSPLFNCDCFSCYASYWVRWDSSPSRQLIHQIIDAYEDSLEKEKEKHHHKSKKNKKDRRKRFVKSSLVLDSSSSFEIPSRLSESSVVNSSSSVVVTHDSGGCNGELELTEEFYSGGEEVAEEEQKGSVKRFVSFIGEKVFGVWG